MRISQIWRRITTTRYARTLEAELALERAHAAEQGIEVARKRAEIDRQAAEILLLRAENRALLNSILGIAGVPPVSASLDDLVATQNQIATSQPPAPRTASHSRSRANRNPQVATPTRRRSWPQIHRQLEFDSAQKEKPATDALPPAHQ